MRSARTITDRPRGESKGALAEEDVQRCQEVPTTEEGAYLANTSRRRRQRRLDGGGEE
jgi:hypothetical protein